MGRTGRSAPCFCPGIRNRRPDGTETHPETESISRNTHLQIVSFNGIMYARKRHDRNKHRESQAELPGIFLCGSRRRKEERRRGAYAPEDGDRDPPRSITDGFRGMTPRVSRERRDAGSAASAGKEIGTATKPCSSAGRKENYEGRNQRRVLRRARVAGGTEGEGGGGRPPVQP